VQRTGTFVAMGMTNNVKVQRTATSCYLRNRGHQNSPNIPRRDRKGSIEDAKKLTTVNMEFCTEETLKLIVESLSSCMS